MQKELLSLRLAPSGDLMGREDILRAVEFLRTECSAERHTFSLILFSIDHFKLINNRFGHRQADGVLHVVGVAARQTLRRDGEIGHWGGDEFLCVLPGADSPAAIRAATRLRERLADLIIPVGEAVTSITTSFGVATFPDNGDSLQNLLTAADEALHEAKRSGRNRVVPAGDLHVPVLSVGAAIEDAVRENRLMPAYQPIYDLRTGEVVAEEALARIITTDESVLSAEDFIDAASQLHLTHKIDRAILTAALARVTEQRRTDRRMKIFVNISAQLLRHGEFLRELLDTARAAGSGTDHAVLEITERELLGEPAAVRTLLAPFIELGFELALDDFGSGYSSFQYLADLPVSYLKIDGRLIQRLEETRVRAIVTGIVRTAAELDVTTMAEYVETARQAELLRDIGTSWAQGHYFGHAIVDESEANHRRRLSVNWAQGYYYRRPRK
jgi:diguanylate cyclase (GGDEF)-like protein